jgi:two-component system response regulator NreC
MAAASPNSQSTRVVLTDDHGIVRHAIRTILESSGEFNVVAEADSCAETVKAVEEYKPEILIIDLGLPGKSGLETILELREKQLQLHIVVLTMYEDELKVLQALRAGARAYLLKNIPPAEFLTALRAVRSGAIYLPARFQHLAAALEASPDQDLSDPLAKLSKREREIFYFLAEGLPNRTVAKKLFISPRTVETHRARILRKFNFASTAELIRFALRNHLISA